MSIEDTMKIHFFRAILIRRRRGGGAKWGWVWVRGSRFDLLASANADSPPRAFSRDRTYVGDFRNHCSAIEL